MRKILMILLVSMLLIGCSIVGFDLYGLFYRPMVIAREPGQPAVIAVQKNATASAFVHLLSVNHMVQSPQMMLFLIRMKGLSNHLKAGFYETHVGESAYQFLLRVVDGDVYVLPFRIIEGSTLKNVAAAVENAPYLVQQPDAYGAIAEGHPSAEGLLLADTYHYDAGSQNIDLLMVAHHNLTRVLNEAFAARAPNLPYKTPYELLIAASIIEKEASIPDERRLISGVILNRLQKRMPLQMDPTVIYALGSNFQTTLTHQDLSIDSPYNTYKHYGLPPTPIAMVGKDAIDAAAHPVVTKYLYFVARGDGGHYFSENYDDQRKAILKYNHRK